MAIQSNGPLKLERRELKLFINKPDSIFVRLGIVFNEPEIYFT